MNGQKSIQFAYRYQRTANEEDYKFGLYRWDPIENKWDYHSGQGENSTLNSLINKNGKYQVFYNPKKAYIPDVFRLNQNYPNPFNPNTVIPFDLKENSQVSLIIYNALGQKVKTLVNENLSVGTHKISWDARNDFGRKVSSGIYFYQLKLTNHVFTKKNDSD
jgi:hypothetical protein